MIFRSCTALAVLLLTISTSICAEELIKWDRLPLQIPLKTGHERVIFVDKNVRIGFPPALNGKLRVQSTGGAVYLRADSDFPQTRLQLQDMESGEVILLDIRADATGPVEPVKVVYRDEVVSVSHSADKGSAPAVGISTTPHRYKAPLPVLLTRYAAQSLYAPLRTVEALPGVSPVNLRLPATLTTLYPSAPVEVMPLAAWQASDRTVVALRVRNKALHKVILDPRDLQGQFAAATFQHRWLDGAGTPEDTTSLYLVISGSPEHAFLPEPPADLKSFRRGP